VTGSTRRTQAERRESTHAALLVAARELFAERGYADTGREDIAERAGVTRGALYHHFESKAAVGVAVLEALTDELAQRVIDAARAVDDPAEQLRRSMHAYIDACADPAFARIVLDAPMMMTPDQLRAMDDAVCARLIEPTLARMGIETDHRATARLLLGMLDQAAALVANEPRTKRRVLATADALLTRLLV
jgi:AcrR family transcriptional regulator